MFKLSSSPLVGTIKSIISENGPTTMTICTRVVGTQEIELEIGRGMKERLFQICESLLNIKHILIKQD